jgi:predicted Zn-dependent protease
VLRSVRGPAAGAALLAVLAAGCERKQEASQAPAPPKGAGVAVSSPASPPPAPVPPGSIGDIPGKKSTDPQIAVGNLEAQIVGGQHLIDKNLNLPLAYTSLCALYLQHGQYLGQLRDYDRADEMAIKELALKQDGQAYLDRASVRQTFHQFAEALTDLDEAQKRHAKMGQVLKLRAGIWQAMGRTQEALNLRSAIADKEPDIMTLGTLATVLADAGRETEADALLARALPIYADVSPFPIAWVDFQRGLMWEKAGQLEKAKTFFQYAVARLPQYAPAEGHLAGVEAALGDRPAAIERLRKLTLSSDDPEYVGQLSAILAQAGKADEAKALLAQAEAGFDDLIKRHPEGFADHAARFWLDVAKDPKKADALAQLNLKNRKSRDAFELSMTAALAAGDNAVACSVADEAMAGLKDVQKLRYLAGRAYAACGKPDKAAALEKAPAQAATP